MKLFIKLIDNVLCFLGRHDLTPDPHTARYDRCVNCLKRFRAV